jgi:hypothetical protein
MWYFWPNQSAEGTYCTKWQSPSEIKEMRGYFLSTPTCPSQLHMGPWLCLPFFSGAGRGQTSRRPQWEARSPPGPARPLPSPQGGHWQGPYLELYGDISQTLLPRTRSPARHRPICRLSLSKGYLSRWVTSLVFFYMCPLSCPGLSSHGFHQGC